MRQLPVLWLCGPPGVGKSTVAWELYAGRPGSAHLDIDQVGMCYPSEADRTGLQARILGRVVDGFAAAGATGLVVSGAVDTRRGVRAEHLTRAALTVLRLRCDQPELRRRLAARARPGEDREAALRAAADHEALAYPVLDTTGRSAAEVLAAVAARWPRQPARPPGPWPDRPRTPGEIVWLCGATAAGKSTIGWEVAERSRRAGHTTGFADLQQLGFLHPSSVSDPGGHRLRAANLAALWAEFHAHGARRLVVVGPVEHPGRIRRYREALPGATLTVHRLHAGPDELRERIRRRGHGGGPPIAGDRLRGQPAAVLARAHAAAVAEAAGLERAAVGDVRIDTDGRSVAAVATAVTDRLRW